MTTKSTPAAQLPATANRPSQAGRNWQGVAHRDLAIAVMETFTAKGICVTGNAYYLGEAEQAITIEANINDFSELQAPLHGGGWRLTVTNSNNRRGRLKFWLGYGDHLTQMTCICLATARKDASFSLQGAAEEAATAVARAQHEIIGQHAELMGVEMTPEMASQRLLDCCTLGALPWSYLSSATAYARTCAAPYTLAEVAAAAGCGLQLSSPIDRVQARYRVWAWCLSHVPE